MAVRTLAKDAGLRVNEYGVFRGEERVAGATEEEVYRVLGLAWVPPELREGRGEVEAAQKGPLPALVEEGDLRGDLHLHLPTDDDGAGVDRLLVEARRRGYAYVGVVGEGVTPEGKEFRLPEGVLRRALKASTPRFRVFRVAELDGLAPEEGNSPSGVDLILRRPSSRQRTAPPLSEDPRPPALVVHLGATGPDAVSTVRGWIAYAAAVDAAVEVGPGPERLDPAWARYAREQRVRLAIPTGLLGSPDDPTLPVALAFARRAGATVVDVANAGVAARLRPKPANG